MGLVDWEGNGNGFLPPSTRNPLWTIFSPISIFVSQSSLRLLRAPLDSHTRLNLDPNHGWKKGRESTSLAYPCDLSDTTRATIATCLCSSIAVNLRGKEKKNACRGRRRCGRCLSSPWGGSNRGQTHRSRSRGKGTQHAGKRASERVKRPNGKRDCMSNSSEQFFSRTKSS